MQDLTKISCNCTNKTKCPLGENCLESCIVYEAEIKAEVEGYVPKKYIGVCETTFKKRYANHLTSFSHPSHRNATELSKEFWEIKERHNAQPTVTWRIMKKCAKLRISSKTCNLCLSEKTAIILSTEKILNKRSEIVSKCRHVNKYMLHRFDTRD